MNKEVLCLIALISILGATPVFAQPHDEPRESIELQYELANTCMGWDRKARYSQNPVEVAFLEQRYQRYCKASLFQRDVVADVCSGYRTKGIRMCSGINHYNNRAPHWRRLFRALEDAQRANHEYLMASQERAFQRALNPYGYNPYGRDGLYVSPGFN